MASCGACSTVIQRKYAEKSVYCTQCRVTPYCSHECAAADSAAHESDCSVDREGRAARQCIVIAVAALAEDPVLARLLFDHPGRVNRVPTISFPDLDCAHEFWDLLAVEKHRLLSDALVLADLLDMGMQQTEIPDNFDWAKQHLEAALDLPVLDTSDADEVNCLQSTRRLARIALLLDRLQEHKAISVSFVYPAALSLISPSARLLAAEYQDIGGVDIVYIQALQHADHEHPRILQGTVLPPDFFGGPAATEMLDIRTGKLIPLSANGFITIPLE
jgi:hypothetical protein